MRYQYIPYIWPLLISGVITLFLGIYTLKQRSQAKGVKIFAITMFLITLWSIPNAFEMSSITLNTKLFWANLQYLAYCFSPVMLLILTMRFTGFDRFIDNKKVLWLVLLPTIIFILVWTNEFHGLIRYNVSLDIEGVFPVIKKQYGFAFIIHAVYSHVLNLITIFLLIKAAFFRKTVYRKQVIALLIGVGMITIPNILYISGISPLKRFDLTPVFFGPAGLIIFWGILRYHMFELVPVARATVIETMKTGVVVLDKQNRIIDTNPAFEKLFQSEPSGLMMKKLNDICKDIPELNPTYRDGEALNIEFRLPAGAGENAYELSVSQLTDKKGDNIGSLGLLYDITEKKKAYKEYLKQQRRQAVIEEKERLSRDMHDNIGQLLGFINLQAQAILQNYRKSGQSDLLKQFERLIEATQTAHEEIREYINSARNYIFLEKGFITGLEKEIAGFEAFTDIKVDLQLPEGYHGDELDPWTRINILNIIKEAFNNIKKHAKANRVTLCLSKLDNELLITIEDNGKGFQMAADREIGKNKFGLEVMRERASEIGGKISIQAEEGKGSCINLIIPIREGEGRNAEENNIEENNAC